MPSWGRSTTKPVHTEPFFLVQTSERVKAFRASPVFSFMRRCWTPLQPATTSPTLPALADADLQEAALLRASDQDFAKFLQAVAPPLRVGDDGQLVTGDAILDQWTRDIAAAWAVPDAGGAGTGGGHG